MRYTIVAVLLLLAGCERTPMQDGEIRQLTSNGYNIGVAVVRVSAREYLVVDARADLVVKYQACPPQQPEAK